VTIPMLLIYISKKSIRRFLTLAQVKAASRIEEEFQLEVWGVVEGGHDMDRLNNSVNLASIGLFMSLCNLSLPKIDN
jgi:chaperone required for assembly of F1-ATPase